MAGFKTVKVEIEIDDMGNPTVSVDGMEGKGCKDLTADYEAAMGAVTDSKPTPDMHKRMGATKGVANYAKR